ncbi:class I SAM-dependent methyltransferase [Paenibacillus lemnae]|uniref:Class I SAM-dependent methyltransferase n=1 Tax=Paenibacillus lemnae TaxID=1330551 RepID=A0A848M4P7_PAELE|nr:class I SAM-dependent methyltransferase [Paenibacillus lemnae]NMO95200.1 class I SAM-dependent methyltransferase [Paenibacillus lemnae]
MLQSLEAIQHFRQNEQNAASAYHWLRLLVSAEERIVNLERIASLGELAKANPVLDYVEKTLVILNTLPVSFWVRELLEETLIWSETAKGGTIRERMSWQASGINLFVHNEGSAELYRIHTGHAGEPMSIRENIIHTLIRTHGLIGQYIRGEVVFAENEPLTALVREGLMTSDELISVLLPLNQCIIGGISQSLWESVKEEAADVIHAVAWDQKYEEEGIVQRLTRLREGSIRRGEDFSRQLSEMRQVIPIESVLAPLSDKTLWFVEAALQDFSAEEFIKVLLLSISSRDSVRHLSFERLMNDMYYDFKGVKKLNVYKKRMIEAYLREVSLNECVEGTAAPNPHLHFSLDQKEGLHDTVFFTFAFSPAAEKLIQFCIEAEKSPLYEKAVLMLFDLFGLRRDAYDRFHNEENYLNDMNGSGDYKAVLLQYVTGNTVIDIGPGGGILLDLLEERLPEVEVVGIDISLNVIEALEKRKRLEGRRWNVMQGDALNLKSYVEQGSVDTIIFSSILHELYSYIEYEGSRFNPATIEAGLVSAYEVLAPGGRIVIRDGIMTEPKEQIRHITFLEDGGMDWLIRYAEDFKGRKIRYEQIGDQKAAMPVNDAMEFLYTYTWGEEAYVHEVQEQFGYFTPSQFHKVIGQCLGSEANILVSRHYLQEGYSEALAGRVEVTDEHGYPADLPDSTCLIVIEKPFIS